MQVDHSPEARPDLTSRPPERKQTMRYRTRVTAPAALIGTAAALTLAPSAHAAPGKSGTPGPETLGDPVYPALGNDGYRVSSYHLDFAYDATTLLVDATTTLRIRTTQALTRFSLDALGLDVRAVRVGGRRAAFEQVGEKLRITPAVTLPDQAKVTVCVEYSADPRRTLSHTGWVATPDGFAVACQPDSAHTVFPCNDHPVDKADFTFRLTVPSGLRGVASGQLVRTETLDGGRTAYTYRSRSPIATEMVQITVGDYRSPSATTSSRPGRARTACRSGTWCRPRGPPRWSPPSRSPPAWSRGSNSASGPTRSRRTDCCRATPTPRSPSASPAWRPRRSPSTGRSTSSRRRRRSART